MVNVCSPGQRKAAPISASGVDFIRLGEISKASREFESVTLWLEKHRAGDPRALDTVTDLVYNELRRLAGYYLRTERPDHTLQATALVHEVYLRLSSVTGAEWENKAQFVAMATQMMRRILVDHSRRRKAQKRGNGLRVPMPGIDPAAPEAPDVEAVDAALDRLRDLHPRKAQVVELRFFGGLNPQEIAQVLQSTGTETSPRTVERDWRFARAWLENELASH
jgi:RNA polymerase sigma-70 factor (ECF subfamily)